MFGKYSHSRFQELVLHFDKRSCSRLIRKILTSVELTDCYYDICLPWLMKMRRLGAVNVCSIILPILFLIPLSLIFPFNVLSL